MNLNAVIALILRFSTEFGRFSINQSINLFVQKCNTHWTGHQGRTQPPLTGAHKNKVSKRERERESRAVLTCLGAWLGHTAGEVEVQPLSSYLTLPLNSNPGTVSHLCVGLFQMQTAKVTVCNLVKDSNVTLNMPTRCNHPLKR